MRINKNNMDKILTTLFLLSYIILLSGCDNELIDDNNDVYSVTTNDVSGVGMFSAVLNAKINMPKIDGVDYIVGFQLSTDSLFPGDYTQLCLVDKIERDGSFSFSIYHTIGYDLDMPSLKPGTQYYFRAFVKFENVAFVGEVKSFKTIPFEIVTGVMEPINNTVNCKVNLLTDDSWISGILGVCYSNTPTPTVNDYTVSIIDKDIALKSDGTFSVTIDNLLYADTIYYRAFYNDKGVVYYGNTQSSETRFSSKIVTLNAEKGPFLIAFLYGRVNGLVIDTLDFERGIEYSTDESFSDENSIRQKVDKKNADVLYSITASGIQPGKKYYYRTYYTYFVNQLFIHYGDVKTFTFDWTAPTVTTLSAELNESDAVVLKGLVKDKGALVEGLSEYFPDDYYGIEYSTTEAFDENSTTILYPDGSTNNMENDSVICIITQYDYGSTYYYRTFFRLGEIKSYGEVKTFRVEWDGTKVVDLGLSVKWATCNVGATYPWDYGDYFAWGEISSKTDYNWSTYRYCYGSSNTMTKYCSNSRYGNNGYTDTKTTLDRWDDVAHEAWGGNWRMPTQSEIDELLNDENCTWTWTTQNGVNGYKVTSKKAGYEGASIFLPAAGYLTDTSLGNAGSYGYYWSSSVDTSLHYVGSSSWTSSKSEYQPYYARDFRFGSNSRSSGVLERYYGISIRPVCP